MAATKKVLTTIRYSGPGTQPPIFLAGSFSDPEWTPEEMQYTTDEQNEHEFYREIEAEEGKEYQYKFRIGLGDWWMLNEGSPTGKITFFWLIVRCAIFKYWLGWRANVGIYSNGQCGKSK